MIARPPRVLFFGSRRWRSLERLHELMWPRVEALPRGAVVVEGDQLGADRAARFLIGELVAGRDWTGEAGPLPRLDLAVASVPPLGRDDARWHRRNVAMAALLDRPGDWAEAFLSGAGGEWTEGSADMARILERAGIGMSAHWLDGSRSAVGGRDAGLFW